MDRSMKFRLNVYYFSSFVSICFQLRDFNYWCHKIFFKWRNKHETISSIDSLNLADSESFIDLKYFLALCNIHNTFIYIKYTIHGVYVIRTFQMMRKVLRFINLLLRIDFELVHNSIYCFHKAISDSTIYIVYIYYPT